jgi:hypothetical protein
MVLPLEASVVYGCDLLISSVGWLLHYSSFSEGWLVVKNLSQMLSLSDAASHCMALASCDRVH